MVFTACVLLGVWIQPAAFLQVGCHPCLQWTWSRFVFEVSLMGWG